MTPRLFGPYELQSLIGVGGMGEVWRARDTRRDRLVAIKLLPESLANDREFTQRFRRESEVAARLREPHVIPIHDYGEIDGRLFIEMRLVDGRDLAGLLQEGPLPPARAVAFVAQIADALDSAHADGLVHRDIKPSNVIVTANDFVYVVDFGIARSLGSTRTALTITGATVGTLDYMAPERFTHEPIDGRTDVYSLACLLCECLTGQRPFPGTDLPSLLYAHLYMEPPRPSQLVEGVPPELDAVVAAGMAKRREDRFATPGELAIAAKAALSAAPTGPVPTAPPTAPSRPAAEPAPAAPYPGEVTPPLAVGLLSADGSHSSVDPLPPPAPLSPQPEAYRSAQPPGAFPPGAYPPGQPPGSPPPPPPFGGPDRAAERRRQRWLVLAGVLVILAVAGALTALLWNRDQGSTASGGSATTSAQTGGSASAGASGKPATPSSAAPSQSIAVPTVDGDPIPVGPSPGYMAVAPNGRFAYIANRTAGVVTVFDTTLNTTTATIPIQAAPPQFVTFSPDGSVAYITVTNADYTYNAVVFVDTKTNSVTATVPVGLRPFAPSTSPDGKLLFVPLHNEGRVEVLDTTTAKEVGSYVVPKNPHWIAISADGHTAYTANHESGVVTVLDLTQGGKVVTTIPVGTSPHSIQISPDGSRVSVVNFDSNNVSVIDTATNTVVATIPVGAKPQDLTYAPDGRHFYTANVNGGTVSVIDTATNSVTATIPTGTSPTSVAVLPDGTKAYVTDLDSGTVRVLRTSSD
ncbi:serine/threonine-protein kinase [Petropleomorpha daqingensis]|uniref:non-specific serine/threonine protein kinase n=1 Tax=Petropleomorpha daqingensis TaxID=2026353 RepID=A0A853CBG9_9ACTN|nr:serine/threonine-protein kinase [Petropleomorpha daqingensis]NYJ04386.1 serine/threonine-protein kinase [Petropleomorpha daqingensis]